MTTTTYTDFVAPAVNAAWLNDLDSVAYKGPVNVLMPLIGAKGDGITNDTAAIQAALNTYLHVYIPANHTFMVDALTQPAGVLITGGGKTAVLKKRSNGDMLTMGLRTEITNVYLDGNGASFTGRGIVIATGSGGDGLQNIHDMWIIDTASYCIDFSASGAGWGARIVNNKLDTYNLTTYAVHFPTTDSNGPRLMALNHSLGPAVDLGGSQGMNVVGNMCGQGPAGGPYTVPSIQMGSGLIKANVVGNAFETTVSIGIQGSIGTWIGNEFNAGYTLLSGATFNKIAHSITTAGYSLLGVDNSGSVSNEIWENALTYTPTWTGSGGNPALGNGTITGVYERKGRMVSVQIHLTMGSTTTFGTGGWSFSLPPNIPAPGTGNSIGSALLNDATGNVYPATSFLAATTISVFAGGSASQITSAIPFTWATSDQLFIGIEYVL